MKTKNGAFERLLWFFSHVFNFRFPFSNSN